MNSKDTHKIFVRIFYENLKHYWCNYANTNNVSFNITVGTTVAFASRYRYLPDSSRKIDLKAIIPGRQPAQP